jgi:transcriptional regulator with XRE-family HTH domain
MTSTNGNLSPDAQVGRRLASAMALRGMGPAELAERTGVHRQTIWRYMAGKVTLPLLPVARMAQELEVRLDYIVYGSGPVTEKDTP